MIGMRLLCSFGKNASELVFTIYQRVHDVDVLTLIKVVPSGLLHHKVTIFPDSANRAFSQTFAD